MNPDLERRLREFGATVDSAAAAEVERRRMTALEATVVADLDPVVAVAGPRRRIYGVLAVAAATLAVVAGGVIFAVGRSGTSTETAERAAPLATPLEPAAAEAPASTRATDSPASTPTLSTTTAAPESSVVPSRQLIPPVCPSYTLNNDYHLEICDRGAAVSLVQERLRATVDPGLDVDGYFGPRTHDAVRSFQQSQGLTVDGQVGPSTWKLLVPHAPGSDIDGSGFVDPSEISTG